MKHRWIFFSVLALFVVLIVIVISNQERSVAQPIEYNHKIHLEEAGLECIDCHQHYNSLARAGIPNIDVCVDCHSEALGDSPVEAAVVKYIENETPIPWNRVNYVPDHVYFSHRRHVKIGRIECAKCHGEMSDLSKPMQKPFKSIKMSWCLHCHEERNVSNDCLRCHR